MNTPSDPGKDTTVVYFSAEPDRQGRASHTHVHEIVNNLRLLGWRVKLANPSHGKRQGGREPGIIGRLFGIGWALLRAILARRPDVYYMRWHFAAFPLSWWARITGVPVVIEVNGQVTDLFIAWPWTARARPFFTWLMNVQLKWASAIIGVTDGLAQMCRNLTSAQHLIAVIPNGANIDKFTPDAAALENAFTQNLPERFVIFFGEMAPWQGIATILAALEQPAWPNDVTCVFAGDGVMRPEVEAAAARLSNVCYIGRVPYDALPAVVARALGGFVSMKDIEGRASTGLSPLKLYETLASGTPAVVGDLPFQAELVRSNQCGTVVPTGNEAELADAVSRLAADEGGRRAMGVRGRDMVVASHSWAARAKDTDDLMRGVLDGKP